MPDATPVYRAMENELRREIELGSLLPGDPLPSEKALSEKYGISRGSTRIALSKLELEGLIEKRTGKGAFVKRLTEHGEEFPPKVIGIDVAGHLAAGYGYYSMITEGAMAACQKLNCKIQLVADESFSNDSVTGLDALILMRAGEHDAGKIERIAAEIPVITVNRRMPDGKIGHVGVDHAMEAFKATEFLVRLGHSRIAFVGNDRYDGSLRRRGYVSSLKSNGLQVEPDLAVSGGFDQSTLSFVRAMLADERPTAVLSASGAYHMTFVDPVLRESRLKVPEEISVLCFDDIEQEVIHYGPPLTCVRMPLAEMGKAAVESVATMNRGSIHQIFHAELVIRQSCEDMRSSGAVVDGSITIDS